MIGDPALAESAFAEALITNAAGNPLFLEETVRMLKDKGMLEAERWQEASELGTLPVPTSLQSLISSRLDRLEREEKEVAHDASIVGAVFWAGAVAHLGAGDGLVAVDPTGGLQTLEQQDFIHANAVSSVTGEDEYAFKHILIRDVAYGQVPKGRRVMLHVRFSDWMTKFPSSADEFVEIVAWHLEQACRLSREVARSPIEPPFLSRQERSLMPHDAPSGVKVSWRHFATTRGHSTCWATSTKNEGLELRLRRADIMMMLGQLKEAFDELEEIIESAATLESPDVQCEALLLLGDIDQRQGRAMQAGRRLADAEELTRAVGDPNLTIKVAFVSSALRADFYAEHDRAIEDLRNAVAIAEEIVDQALAAEGHLRLAAILINRGDLASAEVDLVSCLELARELGSHRLESEATSWLGMVRYYRGDVEEAERLCRQANEWFERTGDTYFQVQNIAHHGIATFALADGRLDEAEEACAMLCRWRFRSVAG